MKTIYYLTLSILSSTSVAQNYEITGSIDDQIRLESDVGTHGVVMGLVRISESFDNIESLKQITAFSSPDAKPEHVCVLVNTADGLYSGKAEYLRSGIIQNQNRASLPYETAITEIYDYQPEEIAVLTTAGPCDSNTEQIIVSTWRASEDDKVSNQTALLVNSSRADAVFVIVNNVEFDCEPLSAGERAAFDYRCLFPNELISSGGDVEIFRENDGNVGLGVPVSILEADEP